MFKGHLKKIIITGFLFFVVLSLISLKMYAQDDIFEGVEDLEVKESDVIDLMLGVKAYDEEQNELETYVDSVTSDTDSEYIYDNSGCLVAGKAGNHYVVEYVAVKDEQTSYSYSRNIRVIEEPNPPMTDSEEAVPEQKPSDEEHIEDKEEALSHQEKTNIIYEGTRHYIDDPVYKQRVILYCMNNKLWWPHYTDYMGNAQVPHYEEGYLTEKDFASKEDYEQCMLSLSRLLYVGYPYNGARLYQIVDHTQQVLPTKQEFNAMLTPNARLLEDDYFSYLRHRSFKYEDWENEKNGVPNENMDILRKFIKDAGDLYNHATPGGLTFEGIQTMPFYRAAYCMVHEADHSNPLENYAYFYPNSRYVTEDQAYDATQLAVWYLLHEYGVEDNNISSLGDSTLAQTMYNYSKYQTILREEPSLANIKLSDSLEFHYNPNDGNWHTKPLRVLEPKEYKGTYYFEYLPKGMKVICNHETYVYANETFEIVSDHEPTIEDSIQVRTNFKWLEALRQYSPSPDVEVQGKKFQHMAGAIIRNAEFKKSFIFAESKEGGLVVKKNTQGDVNPSQEFTFHINVFDRRFNRECGDVTFVDGVANFRLKPGESVTITRLPEGMKYEITEDMDSKNALEYDIVYTNQKGVVKGDTNIEVNICNCLRPDLFVKKKVTGTAGDVNKKFNFNLHLKDKENHPMSITLDFEKINYLDTSKPKEEGTLEIKDGKGSFTLAHGEQIQFKNLPFQSKYYMEEILDKTNPYVITYNGNPKVEEHPLEKDETIEVVNNKELIPQTNVNDTPDKPIKLGVFMTVIGLLSAMILCVLQLKRKYR